MTESEFKERTKRLGLRIIRMVRALPEDRAANVIGAQILRSGTGIGANYRSACRAKSVAHMISKLGDVEEEADETLFWLELIEGDQLLSAGKLTELKKETVELLKMVVASRTTLKRRLAQENVSRRSARRPSKNFDGSSADTVREPRSHYNRKSKIGNRK